MQMRPSSIPREILEEIPLGQTGELEERLDTVDCPTGTIPILRSSTAANTTIAGSMPPPLMIPDNNATSNDCQAAFYYSYRATEVGRYYGATSKFSIHQAFFRQPSTQPFQASGASLVVNDANGAQGEGITVGWMVSHFLYNDYNPRLFASWQVNDKGCWNLQCPGFVQTSSKTYLGAPFRWISEIGGKQYSAMFHIFKDRESSHYWWFALWQTREVIGYWTDTIFHTLADSGAQVEAGGYVSSPTPALTPSMGSGMRDVNGFGYAAYASAIGIVNDNNTIVKPSNMDMQVWTDPAFYTLGDLRDDPRLEWGLHFYYGGPGAA